MSLIKSTDKLVEGSSNLFFTNGRAQAAVQSTLDSLQSQITSEVSRAQGSETTLGGQISGEVSRAQAAEGVIAGNLASEISRAQGIESGLRSDLSSEVSRAQGVEQGLNARLQSLEADPTTKTYVDGQISSLNTSLSGSISSAVTTSENYTDVKIAQLIGAAPSMLQTLAAIDTYLQNTTDAGVALAATVSANATTAKNYTDAETSRAQGIEAGFSSRLGVLEGSGAGSVAKALVDAKAYADGLISTEVSNRNAAILVEENRALGVEAQLQSDLTAEVNRATSAESDLMFLIGNLQSDLASEITRAQGTEALMLLLDGSKPMTAALDMGFNEIHNVSGLRSSNGAGFFIDFLLGVITDSGLTNSVDFQNRNLIDQYGFGAINCAERQLIAQNQQIKLSWNNDEVVVSGGMKAKVGVVSDSYSIQPSDYIVGVDNLSAARTMTLPSASDVGAGKMFVIKDQSGQANASKPVSVAAPAGQTVDGQASYNLIAGYESATVYSDGSNWFVM